ncbi:MAG: S9 family peptidase [Vulcanimicrobiaceae bacterium]
MYSARIASALAALLAALPIPAPSASEPGYRKLPPAIETVLSAPAFPTPFVAPARDVVLLATPLRLPPVADLARPMLRLAGLRIDPATNGVHHAPAFVSFEILRIASGVHTRIALPASVRASAPVWSSDGTHFAFANATASGTELWLASTATATATRFAGVRLNSLFGDAVAWMPDGRRLLVHAVAPDRGAAPPGASDVRGPAIQESLGQRAPAVTYEDLLRDERDAATFAYYAAGRYGIVDTASHELRWLSKSGIFAHGTVSPDGRFVAFTRLHPPFSYQVPWPAFPHQTVIVETLTHAARSLADVPLQERAGFDDVPPGPRDVAWRPTAPATLVYAEATGAHGDRVESIDFAKNGPIRQLATLPGHVRGIDYVADSSRAFVRDYDRERRVTQTTEIDLDASAAPAATHVELRDGDLYNDPGRPLAAPGPNGEPIVLRDGNAIFYMGDGYGATGRRPFVDRVDLATHRKKRIFQSATEPLETVIAALDERGDAFLVQRQSPTAVPDLFVRRIERNDVRQLTHYVDPAPALRTIGHRTVTYKRADGVDCSFVLYTPPGTREGARLPTLLWAYPFEFGDAALASQNKNFVQTFDTVSGASPILAALAGYAVLDNVSMPIVGNPKTVNDTFVNQLTLDARAAIDKAVEIGVSDRDRIAVGGHSYGAFMTANLLAHTKLFRAGIARSGAYNRSLTPFGFQNERRTFWDAPALYNELSPFSYADRITEPLLLVHGELDDNTGTFPLQSERFYAALRGNGGTARLVMLPYEAHGYVGRESVETTIAEMIGWLDRYVRDAPRRADGERR